MHPRMKDRLDRLEAQRGAPQQSPPPGMIPVLMFAIASRLGGYPQPRDQAPPYLDDGVSDGLARALGYRDGSEMDREAKSEAGTEAWGARMEAAFTELLRTEGIDRGRAGEPARRRCSAASSASSTRRHRASRLRASSLAGRSPDGETSASAWTNGSAPPACRRTGCVRRLGLDACHPRTSSRRP